MPNILLLVSPSCGACPSAKSLWKQLRVKSSFSYRAVDIPTEDGPTLRDRPAVRAVHAPLITGTLPVALIADAPQLDRLLITLAYMNSRRFDADDVGDA